MIGEENSLACTADDTLMLIEGRVGRNARYGLQPRLLGRLLSGSDFGRVEQQLRIERYGEERSLVKPIMVPFR